MNEWHKTREVQFRKYTSTQKGSHFSELSRLYLVQFLELHHLEEDVLKDMFGILLVLW